MAQVVAMESTIGTGTTASVVKVATAESQVAKAASKKKNFPSTGKKNQPFFLFLFNSPTTHPHVITQVISHF